MPAAEESVIKEAVSAAGKDIVVGLGIGIGLYILWVLAHSILFGMGG